MSKDRPDIDYEAEPGKALRWIGILLPPLAWGMQLQAVWLTTEWGCASGDFRWTHVASITGLALSAIGCVIAWQQYPGGEWERTKEGGTPDVRRRFMSILGMVMGVLFLIVIVAQWLPTLVGVPCNK